MASYHDRLVRIRHQRIMKKTGGRKLIHDEMEMLGLIEGDKVPTMIQHCVIKVMKKMHGSDKEKFLSAFNICSATFSKYGYTRSGTMTMTGAGIRRNRRHQREKEASSKKTRYTNLVSRLWKPAIKRMKEETATAKSANVRARMAKIKAKRSP